MKKYIAIILTAIMIFGVSACSNTNTNETEPIKQEETQNNTDIEDIQDDNTTNETTELAEFDITGDEFISRINELAEGLNQPFVLENFQVLEGEKETDDINQITYFTIAENDVWIYYIINKNSNKLHSVLFMINNDKLNEINYLNACTYFLIASAALDPEPKSDDFEKNLNLSDYSQIKENGLYDTQKARYVKMLTEDNYLLSIEAK